MKKREFNNILKELSDPKTEMLDKLKIKQASKELKTELINYLVRNRGTIIVDLIHEDIDISNLHACGYLYFAKNKYFDFLITSEQQHLFGDVKIEKTPENVSLNYAYNHPTKQYFGIGKISDIWINGYSDSKNNTKNEKIFKSKKNEGEFYRDGFNYFLNNK